MKLELPSNRNQLPPITSGSTQILKMGDDINAQGGKYKNALQAASLHPLPRLHHLHPQLFSLFPASLVPLSQNSLVYISRLVTAVVTMNSGCPQILKPVRNYSSAQSNNNSDDDSDEEILPPIEKLFDQSFVVKALQRLGENQSRCIVFEDDKAAANNLQTRTATGGILLQLLNF